jgi:hypothetical protein
MREEISIVGLNKAKVLLALHQGSRSQGMSFLHEKSASLEECEARLLSSLYVDYFLGRVIKVDFSGDMIDSFLYNRDNGEYAMLEVILKLRREDNE